MDSPVSSARRHSTPVVLVAGFMAPSKLMEEYWTCALTTAAHRPVLTSYLSPVGSSEDRARQLFYQIKGGVLDFGSRFRDRGMYVNHRSGICREFSAAHVNSCDHLCTVTTDTTGLVKSSLEHTSSGQKKIHALDANLRHTHGEMFSQIHCVGHSFGGQTIRVLQQLLSEGAFEEHCTCAGWIRSITCISSPLNGSLAVYALGAREVPLGRLLPAHAAPPPTNAPKHTPSTSSPPLSSCWRRAVAAVCSTAAHVAGWHQPVRCCSAGYLIGMVAHLWELVDLPHLHEGIFHFDVARFGVGRRRRGCAAAALHCGTAGCPVGAGSALFQHANCAPADMTLQGAYLWNRRILHQQDTYYFSFVGDSFGLTEARGAAHDVTGDGGEEGEEGLQAEVAESTKSPCPRRSLTRKVVSTLDPPTDTPTATASAAGAEVRPVFLSEEGSHADGARTVLRALQWHVGWHTPWMDRSCFPFVVHPGTGAWGPSAWMDGGGDGLLALPEQAVPLHTPAIGASGTTCLLDARKHVQSCSEARPIALSPPPFVLVDTPPVSSDFANWMKSHSACAEPSPSTPAANSPRSRLRFQPRAGVWHVLRHGSDHVGVVPAPVGSLPQAGFFARLWRLLDEVDVQCG